MLYTKLEGHQHAGLSGFRESFRRVYTIYMYEYGGYLGHLTWII